MQSRGWNGGVNHRRRLGDSQALVCTSEKSSLHAAFYTSMNAGMYHTPTLLYTSSVYCDQDMWEMEKEQKKDGTNRDLSVR